MLPLNYYIVNTKIAWCLKNGHLNDIILKNDELGIMNDEL
jgi:hypothetical protein